MRCLQDAQQAWPALPGQILRWAGAVEERATCCDHQSGLSISDFGAIKTETKGDCLFGPLGHMQSAWKTCFVLIVISVSSVFSFHFTTRSACFESKHGAVVVNERPELWWSTSSPLICYWDLWRWAWWCVMADILSEFLRPKPKASSSNV